MYDCSVHHLAADFTSSCAPASFLFLLTIAGLVDLLATAPGAVLRAAATVLLLFLFAAEPVVVILLIYAAAVGLVTGAALGLAAIEPPLCYAAATAVVVKLAWPITSYVSLLSMFTFSNLPDATW